MIKYLLKEIFATVVCLLLGIVVASFLSCVAHSQEISKKVYWSAVGVTGVSSGLDAYTTIAFIGRGHYCSYEAANPGLYGEFPKPGRVALVMGGEFAGSVVVSWTLKRFVKQKYLRGVWAAPLAYVTSEHLPAAIHNFKVCP